MTLIVHTMEQGSPDWFAIRAGKPTASEFSTVLAKGEGKTRRTYLLKLAGELYTGDPMESYVSQDMLRGKEQEGPALDRYALLHDAEPIRVGFLEETDVRAGASPDALIGERGMLELKSAYAHILIDKLTRDVFPPEHVAQCQGNLWIAGRDYIDLAIFCPKMPLFTKRAFRDETYIRNLASEVARFNDDLAETVERIRRYGAPPERAPVNIISGG